jgi:hypothetical protein
MQSLSRATLAQVTTKESRCSFKKYGIYGDLSFLQRSLKSSMSTQINQLESGASFPRIYLMSAVV